MVSKNSRKDPPLFMSLVNLNKGFSYVLTLLPEGLTSPKWIGLYNMTLHWTFVNTFIEWGELAEERTLQGRHCYS